jgi:hypothetical protein
MPVLIRSVVAALAVTLVVAPAASAQERAAVGGGQTMLRIDAGVAKAIQQAGLGVSLLRPARNGASGATFPASGGSLDPATLRGSVSHRGGLRFHDGPTSVRLRNFRYRIGARRATLSAAVGGTRLTILRLDLSRARVGARGPLTKTASRITARLTAGAARALNAAFDTTLFRGGLRLGTVRTEVELAEAVLADGVTTLRLDDGAAQALRDLNITPGVVGNATAGGAGLGFPITGGKVDAATLAGSIRHSGGISLTRGDTRVELTDFTIGIDDSPALSALVGGQRVEILSLDVSGITRSVRGRTIVVQGVVARLTAAAAGALNQAFSTDAFREGLTIGTATVAAEPS